MKKIFMGAGALALTIGAVAFTTAPKKTDRMQGTFYFAVTATAGNTPLPEETLQTTNTFGCTGVTHFCAGQFSGTFQTTAGGNWIPTADTQAHGELSKSRKS